MVEVDPVVSLATTDNRIQVTLATKVIIIKVAAPITKTEVVKCRTGEVTAETTTIAEVTSEVKTEVITREDIPEVTNSIIA